MPGTPADESCTRFRFAGSITQIGNFILINYDAINKTDRKTYHWKQQNISFSTHYPLNKAVAMITQLTQIIRNYQIMPRAGNSQVWSYFEKISSSVVKCKVCKVELSYSGGSTSSMLKHLTKQASDVAHHYLQ